MSKKVLSIGLSIVGVALMAIPGIGTALGLGALSIAGASISVASLIGLGLTVAGSFLMGPAKPKGLSTNPLDRLTASLDPTTPRKIVFGHTAMATDVRYQAFTGDDQEYLEQIICTASHKVHSQDELWLDNEMAWSASGGVTSKFASFLTVTAINEGTSSNGIAIDTIWTTSCTLTGCAYIHLKMLLIHDAGDGTNDSPFASGVTSRMTIRGKGALIYDPRLDGTVDGGSGTQRADDQSTWAWDDDASRNPALQELWYELGWKVNSKLMVGKGVPKARIDLASYAVAANACDEDVTLSDGTSTEPRYRGDGVVSEGDDPSAVRDNLCASMNAVLRDAGGKLSINVLHNDLSSPVTPSGRTAFDQSDIIGEINWDQTPSLASSFNIVRGRRVDPSDNALYQMVDVPEVSLTAPDGIDRIDTYDLPLVQSNGQAQRLFKQRLERNQYQGRLSFTGKSTFWGLTLGDPFELTVGAYGWTEKLFRCAGHKMNRDGTVDIVAVEENTAIYAWDNDESAAVTPGTPTVYDAAANHPIQRKLNDALIGSTVIDPLNDVIVYADSSGTVKSGELPRDIAITASNISGDITTSGTWSRTATSGITCTIGSGTGILNITALAVAEVTIPISFVYGGVTRTASVHVLRSDDPVTSGGGSTGGTTASTTSLGATSGTTYASESSALTVTAGSAGKVTCTAPIGFKRTPGTDDGVSGCYGKWQWRVPAGTWADIDTEVQDTQDSATTTTDITRTSWGSLSVTMTKTGLTSGNDYEFKFLWRRNDVSGTAEEVYRASGTLTADGTVA